jgi:class 3 adenylate cyclase
MASRTVLQVNPPAAVCARCRTLQPAGSNFCGECGTRLGAAPALKPARCASRRASVLFCDVVGYTAISARLDPEDVFTLMERAFDVVLDAVHHHGGSVNQFLGDGAMALFDDAEDAIAAGQRILDGLEPLAADARRRHGVTFGMRLGVHTGTIAIGAIGVDLRVDYTALGATARVAASLLRVARRGELVVTETTRRLAATTAAFEPRGEVGGDEDAEPTPVYAVVDDASVAALGWRYESGESIEVPDVLYA